MNAPKFWCLIPNQAKLHLYLFTFVWLFSYTFGMAYSPLNSATLNCSSEITLLHLESENTATINFMEYFDHFSRYLCSTLWLDGPTDALFVNFCTIENVNGGGQGGQKKPNFVNLVCECPLSENTATINFKEYSHLFSRGICSTLWLDRPTDALHSFISDSSMSKVGLNLTFHNVLFW